MSDNDEAQDRIYDTVQEPLPRFAFNEQVAAVFPDMIRRSVPGYATAVALAGLVAGEYAQPNSRCYDLGCSLGAATLAMRHRIAAPGCRIVAVDRSEAMTRRCREHVESDMSPVEVDVVCADLREVAVEDASVVTLLFTLQFIEPDERPALLRRIREGMRPGGVLLLAEKVVFDDPAEQQFQESMHLAFKRANGYSDLEISQKRAALEQVLVPETLAAHEARLREAGFSTVHRWFQCFNFAALVAFAP